MADSERGQVSPRETALAALRAQREDAKVALAWFAGSAYARIEERYQAILAQYERLLRDPNIDSPLRDRACMAVMVAEQFLGVKAVFARQLKSSEAQLAELEHEGKPSEKAWERILTFMR